MTGIAAMLGASEMVLRLVFAAEMTLAAAVFVVFVLGGEPR